MSEKFEVYISIQSILTILREGEVTRKRVRKKYYPEKLLNDKENKFKELYKKLHSYTPKKIISLDETSIYINMTQTYGYSKRGQRAVITTHTYPFKRFNVLCAIRYNKVVGIEIYEELKGGVKQKELTEFINKYIKEKYKKNLILLDNAMPHRANKVKEVMKASGNDYMYAISYHPETNPIEEFFSQLKHYVRKESPQNYKEIKKVVMETIKTKISKENLTNYINHSYNLHKKYH